MTLTQTSSDNPETMSDAEFRARVIKQLDHLDTMVHEIAQVAAELAPHARRAIAARDKVTGLMKGVGRGKATRT
jgi:hypothetical protein